MVGQLLRAPTADPDRAGVVVQDVELVAVLVHRDDVAGLVPGVADGVRGGVSSSGETSRALVSDPGAANRVTSWPRSVSPSAAARPPTRCRRSRWAGSCTRGSDEGACTAPPRIRCARASGAPDQVLPRQSRGKRGHAASEHPPAQAGAGAVGLGRAGVGLVPVGHRTLGQAVDQRPISLSGYRRWPPRVRTKGSLPSLAHRETVLGDTCSRAAACDAVRCLGSLGLGWRIALLNGHGPPDVAVAQWDVEPRRRSSRIR